jgi:alkyl hydroperoxide reductase subunit AhpC
VRISKQQESGVFSFPIWLTLLLCVPQSVADLAEIYALLKEKGVEVWSVSTDTVYIHVA